LPSIWFFRRRIHDQAAVVAADDALDRHLAAGAIDVHLQDDRA